MVIFEDNVIGTSWHRFASGLGVSAEVKASKKSGIKSLSIDWTMLLQKLYICSRGIFDKIFVRMHIHCSENWVSVSWQEQSIDTAKAKTCVAIEWIASCFRRFAKARFWSSETQ